MKAESEWWSATKAWGLRMVVDALFKTYRLHSAVGSDKLRALREGDQSGILCLWHNRILCCTYHLGNELAWNGRVLKLLVSESSDGELISRVIEAWGAESIRGSTSGDGGRALRQLTRALAAAPMAIVMTPDGPRGPIHRVQAGTIVLAQLSGVPIYPMSCSAERAWRLRSWDRFMVPKPFSRISAVVGQPMQVPRDLNEAGREEARLALETALHAADEEAAAVFESIG